MVKKNSAYKKLIIAIPVAPATSETVNALTRIADKMIILYTPEEFSAVGQFYQRFDQVDDEEVKEIMRKYLFEL